MRRVIKLLVRFLARNPYTWALLNPTLLRVSRSIDCERRLFLAGNPPVDIRQAIQECFPDLVVRHGPFQGMRYPVPEASGSLIFPKLLGSYERELHCVIEQLIQQRFSRIIDIGCAEGFYAVGLAQRLPDAVVFAFDANPQALILCEAMKQINNIDDRLQLHGSCTVQSLLPLLQSESPTLIICDCEGYEKILFQDHILPHLRLHTLLIETHDVFDLSISPYLKSLFASSHQVTTIRSIDDVQKVHEYQYRELERYSLAARKILLAEYRQSIMDWLLLTPLAKK